MALTGMMGDSAAAQAWSWIHKIPYILGLMYSVGLKVHMRDFGNIFHSRIFPNTGHKCPITSP